jgi:hypothetical protein
MHVGHCPLYLPVGVLHLVPEELPNAKTHLPPEAAARHKRRL